MNRYVLLGVGILVVVGLVTYNLGFIPVAQSIKSPSGNYKEIKIDIDSKEDLNQYIKELMYNAPPDLDIDFSVFETDISISEVFDDYEGRLNSQGYDKAEDYCGYTTYEEEQIYYNSYIKGFIVVAIACMRKDCCNTYVLYTTGSIFDYQELFEWADDRGLF